MTRDAAVVADQHVVGLEVAVHEAGVVRRRQPRAGRDEAVEHLAPRRGARGHSRACPLDQLHGDEDLIADGADVVDR